MSIVDILGDIKSREIVLYGVKEEIQQFLQRYNTVLNIKCIVSEYMDDVRLQSFEGEWGLRTYSFDEVSFSENALVVVCTRKNYSSYVKRLLYTDKKEYTDYVSMELVECALHKKKLMVCMGTQLIRQVASFLNSSSDFTEVYHVVYFAENELMQPYINRIPEAAHICRYCDVYLASSCEKDRFNIRKLDGYIRNESCIKIKVSDYGFFGYFPQVLNNRDKMSEYLLREHERLDIDYETLSFARLDREIFNRIEKNYKPEDIKDELLGDGLFDQKTIKEIFDKEVERFAELEREDDIQLSDFIRDNKTKRLCRNLNEWNEPVVSYVSDSVLKLLEFEPFNVDIDVKNQLIEEGSGGEMVIYPCVEKAHEIEECKDRYKVVTLYASLYMSRDEFIQYHIKYLSEAYELMHYTKMYLDLEQ